MVVPNAFAMSHREWRFVPANYTSFFSVVMTMKHVVITESEIVVFLSDFATVRPSDIGAVTAVGHYVNRAGTVLEPERPQFLVSVVFFLYKRW